MLLSPILIHVVLSRLISIIIIGCGIIIVSLLTKVTGLMRTREVVLLSRLRRNTSAHTSHPRTGFRIGVMLIIVSLSGISRVWTVLAHGSSSLINILMR